MRDNVGCRVDLDHRRAAHLLAEFENARLQVRLVLLGRVVLRVLLEVSPLPSRLDPGRDRAAPVALKPPQLLLQRPELGFGHRNIVHAHPSLEVSWSLRLQLPLRAIAGTRRAARSPPRHESDSMRAVPLRPVRAPDS